jgi:hypothetical protein
MRRVTAGYALSPHIDPEKAMGNDKRYVYAAVNAIGREVQHIDFRFGLHFGERFAGFRCNRSVRQCTLVTEARASNPANGAAEVRFLLDSIRVEKNGKFESRSPRQTHGKLMIINGLS